MPVQGRLCGDLPDLGSLDASLGGLVSAYLTWTPEHGSLQLRLLSSLGDVLAQASGTEGALQGQAQSPASGAVFVEVSSTSGGQRVMTETMQANADELARLVRDRASDPFVTLVGLPRSHTTDLLDTHTEHSLTHTLVMPALNA